MKTIKKYEIKANQTDLKQAKISTSKDGYEYILQFYSDDLEVYESSFILLLNRANKVIGYAKISQGGVAGTVIDIKIVMKYVVDTLASGFIIAHNHPSGSLFPSKQDDVMTNNLKSISKMLDCVLLDHLIITTEGYYSYADSGALAN